MTDDALSKYHDRLVDFKSLCIIRAVLRGVFCDDLEIEPRNYWLKVQTLCKFHFFYPRIYLLIYVFSVEQVPYTRTKPVLSFPIKNAENLQTIDDRIASEPEFRGQIKSLLSQMFLMSQKKLSNLLPKILDMEFLQQCSWCRAKNKRNLKLHDFLLFRDILPDVIGIKLGKQMDDAMRLAFFHVRRRIYARDFRLKNRLTKKVENGYKMKCLQ